MPTDRDMLVAQCARMGLSINGTTHKLRKRLLAHMMCAETADTVIATAVPVKTSKKRKREPSA